MIRTTGEPVAGAVPEKPKKRRGRPSVSVAGTAVSGVHAARPAMTRLLISLPADLVAWLDDERFVRRMQTRVDLIRALLGEARGK